MWGQDPLTKNHHSHEMRTGQQQPAAAHSNNLQPAACAFAVLLQPQMPFTMRHSPGKGGSTMEKLRLCLRLTLNCLRLTLNWKRPFTKTIYLSGSQVLFRAMTMIESLGEPFQNTDP